jgi:hypothetical protein
MSPVDIPQLPYEDGSTDASNNLLPPFDPNYVPEQGEAFTPSGEVTPGYFDPEVRQALPYTESLVPYADPSAGISFSSPMARESFINTSILNQPENPPVAPPQVVDDNAYANNLLAQWQAQDKIASDKKWVSENETPIMGIAFQVGAGLGSPVAAAGLNILAEQQYKNDLAKKYEWTNGEAYPAWDKFRNDNYGDKWKELNLSQQREVFDYWTKSSAEYWIGLNGVKEKEFEDAFNVARNGGLKGQFDSFADRELGEDSEWIRKNISGWESLMLDESVGFDKKSIDAGIEVPSKDSNFVKGFNAKTADLIASKLKTKQLEIISAKNLAAEYSVFDKGRVTKEGITEAKAKIEEEYNFEISDPGVTEQEVFRARQKRDSEISKLNFLESFESPESEITKYNEAYQRLRRIRQNILITASPETRAIVESKTAGDLWKNYIANPKQGFAYYFGEGMSQSVEMVPETAASVGIGALTGIPATPLIAGATGLGSANQEIEAIIPQLIEERMEREGLSPENSESWEIMMMDKGFYNDVVAEAQRKGIATGLITAGLTSLFSKIVDLIPYKGGALKNTAGFLARRASEFAIASPTTSIVGELGGQFVQNPSKPFDWLAASQELLADLPGQTQQSALETSTSLIQKGLNRYQAKEPTQIPTDAGTTTEPTQTGAVTLDSIEAELGAKVPQTSTQVPQEDGATPTATDGNVTPPSGQDLAAEDVAPTDIVRAIDGMLGVDRRPYPAKLSAQDIQNPEGITTRDALAEEEFRQSDEQAALLHQQLMDEMEKANAIPATAEFGENIRRPRAKGKVKTAEESFNQENPNVDIQPLFAENQEAVEKIVELSRKIRPKKTKAAAKTATETPIVTIAPEDFSTTFRAENAALPEKAQAAWTTESYVAVDEFFKTGNEEALAGLNKIQQNRARAHYYGSIEEAEAKQKGMSVEQLYNSKRNQGGFLDIPAIGQGVAEAAVTAWSKAKDFASWSVEMVDNFGQKVLPYLKELWNRVNTLVKHVSDAAKVAFSPYTENQGSPRPSSMLPDGKEVTVKAYTKNGTVEISMEAKDADAMLEKRESSLKALLDCL